MGNIIIGNCECGYSSGDIYQGGGFLTFMNEDKEPAYCKKCKLLIVLNYKEPNSQCSSCGGKVKFYNDPSLKKNLNNQIKKNNIIQWGDFFLPNVDYLCPECGEFKMKFFGIGFWD
jgi:hypothetical protein